MAFGTVTKPHEYSARWYRVDVTPWLILINQGVFCSMAGWYSLI